MDNVPGGAPGTWSVKPDLPGEHNHENTMNGCSEIAVGAADIGHLLGVEKRRGLRFQPAQVTPKPTMIGEDPSGFSPAVVTDRFCPGPLVYSQAQKPRPVPEQS